MNGKTLDERVTDLEKLAQTLAPLPEEVRGLKVRVAAVESQIVHLRTDMNVEFSAIRGEMAAMKDELREDIVALGRETAAHVLRLHRGFDDIRGEIQRSTQKVLDRLNER
jgi:phosphoglycerate-specific signal transduction histidine kinase